jgi:hypothetical protein
MLSDAATTLVFFPASARARIVSTNLGSVFLTDRIFAMTAMRNPGPMICGLFRLAHAVATVTPSDIPQRANEEKQ